MGTEETVAIKLTQEQQVMVSAVVSAIKEELQHECFFDVKQRKHLHELVDAIEDEGATRSTHIIILRAGKAWEDVTKRLSRVVMWFIIVLVAVVLGIFFGKPAWGWINK